tara:strand:- start:1931 stop:2506 length:576 start_codon:yes stop_codon:yes gene_type:complete
MLGSAPLSSFSEGTDAAQICDRLFSDIVDTIILSYPFSFTIKKSQLARSVDTPANEYDYMYPLPSDMLSSTPRALYIGASAGVTPVKTGWEVYGTNIFTDYSTVFIDYQFRPEPDVMPTYFVQLIKYWMAWHIAEAVTDQITKAQYFQTLAVGTASENMRGGMLRTAMHIDGSGEPTRGFTDFPLLTERAS